MNLYIDCDGVILNTIIISYRELRKLGYLDENYKQIKEYADEIRGYYATIDWNELLKEADEINNSICAIRKIVDSGKFQNVQILTHINSAGEGVVKKEYFEKLLPDVPVRLVAKHVSKADAVDPINSILIDDHSPNLVEFEEKGGLGIKFDEEKTEDYRSHIQNGKTYEFLTINNLEDILNINFELNKPSVKVKQKTF